MKERIGSYRIVSELGRGGMGIVYKAHEESLNRHVAIKVLGEDLTEDPDYVERFLREARSAARLNHPNIVQIHMVGEDQGCHYFVMEYVSGASLHQLLRTQGRIAPAAAAGLIQQAAAGLAAAHDQGIIHRDIKPGNLLLDERGLIKIADFGLALMSAAASRLTATGMLMGTPGYLAPEQCLDAEVDQRTDIYSLGVTFFEMLTGKMPFSADSPLALLRQIVDVQPADVCTLNPDVDAQTRRILGRMMAKDRDQRYPSCHELVADLGTHLAQVSGDNPIPGVGTPPGVVVAPLTPPSARMVDSAPTALVSTPAPAPPPPLPGPPPMSAAPAVPAVPAVPTAPTVQAVPTAPAVPAVPAVPAPPIPSAELSAPPRSWLVPALVAAVVVCLVALGGVSMLLLKGSDAGPAAVAQSRSTPEATAEDQANPTSDPTGALAPSAADETQAATAPSAADEAQAATGPSAAEPAPSQPDAAGEAQGQAEPVASKAPPPIPRNVAILIARLNSDDSAAERTAAKLLYRRHRRDPRVQEAARRALVVGFNLRIGDSDHVDAMAWLCNILGTSGNRSYVPTLTNVLQNGRNRKVRGYAEKALNRLR